MKAARLTAVGLALLLVGFCPSGCSSSSNDGNGDGGLDGQVDQDGTDQQDGSGGDAAGNGDGTNGGGDVPICDEMEITASTIPPNLLLVVDKSGSMEDPTSGNSGPTKMQDLKDAVHMLLTEGQGSIRFGWMYYPDCTSCNQDYCDAGRVSVEVGDDTVGAIRNRLDALGAAGGTPTGESLEAADAYFTGLGDQTHPSFVLLITDGLPTCPTGNGRDATQADAQRALEAVEDLHSHQVDTFVIGLGEGVNNTNPQLLNDMALAGGRPRGGQTKYYQANSLAELEAILSAIGGMVIGCNIALDVVPEFPAWLWVYFDGQAVPKDESHTKGWDYDAQRNAIDFYGDYCDQLRNGEVEHLEVLMGCAPPD